LVYICCLIFLIFKSKWILLFVDWFLSNLIKCLFTHFFVHTSYNKKLANVDGNVAASNSSAFLKRCGQKLIVGVYLYMCVCDESAFFDPIFQYFNFFSYVSICIITLLFNNCVCFLCKIWNKCCSVSVLYDRISVGFSMIERMNGAWIFEMYVIEDSLNIETYLQILRFCKGIFLASI
jgi:hypothetical protein